MTDIAGIIGASTIDVYASSATRVDSSNLSHLAQQDEQATLQLEVLMHALQSTANSFNAHKPETD